MESTDLTIIMPVYNGARYLNAAIDSILKQTYGAFQLIIINDGSTDETAQIIGQYDDPRILCVTNPANRGVSYCRNLGLQLANTRFVAYFDADDVARSDKFMCQITFLKNNPEFSLVGSSVLLTNANGRRIGNWRLHFSSNRLPVEMLFRNCLVTSAVLFRRSAAAGFSFPHRMDIGEDWLLWWHLLQNGKGKNLQKNLIRYRQHEDSLMSRLGHWSLIEDHTPLLVIMLSIGLNITLPQLMLLTHLKHNVLFSKEQEIRDLRELFIQMALCLQATGRHRNKDVLIVFAKRWLKAIYLSWKHPSSRKTAIRLSGFLLNLYDKPLTKHSEQKP